MRLECVIVKPLDVACPEEVAAIASPKNRDSGEAGRGENQYSRSSRRRWEKAFNWAAGKGTAANPIVG